jgi:5-formyltetrahydrofolate cyclo-ligase
MRLLIKPYKRSWFIQPNKAAFKARLREEFRARRAQISTGDRQSAGQSATHFLIEQPIFHQSEYIAIYLPVRNEFDTTSISQAIWQAHKQCYLPVLTEHQTLKFMPYHSGDALRLNRYSIPEPVNTSANIPIEHLDLVIIPLVAFDLLGHRLGAGGGYYDRTFAFTREMNKPVLMGLGYASQQADLLPVDEWDVRLDMVLTEEGILVV